MSEKRHNDLGRDPIGPLLMRLAVPTVTAQLVKNASFDFYCAHTENEGVYGYDLVTRLGSALTFTGQSAVLEDREQIKIVRQNFGFEPESGIRTVELNPEEEHYYLAVRRVETEE